MKDGEFLPTAPKIPPRKGTQESSPERLHPRGNPLPHAWGAEGLLAGARGWPEPAAVGSAGYMATLTREQTAGSNYQRSTLPACVKPSGRTTGDQEVPFAGPQRHSLCFC